MNPIKPNNHINDFKCCQPSNTLNMVFTEQMTLEEVVYALINKTNEIISTVNSFQEYVNQVEDLLKDLNTHISEITYELLEQWYNDGKLQEMLQNVSDAYFEDLGNQLNEEQEKMQKILDEFLSYPQKTPLLYTERVRRQALTTGYANIYDTTPHHYECEGGGFYKGHYMLWYNHTEKDAKNGFIRIYETDTTNQYTDYTLPFGHGNSFFVYNDVIYIAGCGANANASLSIMQWNFRTTTYNKIDIKGLSANVNTVYMGCSYDNKVYLYCMENGATIPKANYTTASIWELDMTTYTATFLFNFGNVVNSYATMQDMCANKDGFWILGTEPNVIYNISFTGELIYEYRLGLISSDYHLFGECENICFLPDEQTLIIGSQHPIDNANINIGGYAYSQAWLTQFHQCNPYNNHFTRQPWDYNNSEGVLTLWVNQQNSGINPGGDWNNPDNTQSGNISGAFWCIQEAYNYARNIPGVRRVEIRLRSNDRIRVVLDSSVPLQITNNLSSTDDSQLLRIANLYCNLGSSVLIGDNIRAVPSVPATLANATVFGNNAFIAISTNGDIGISAGATRYDHNIWAQRSVICGNLDNTHVITINQCIVSSGIDYN